MFVLDASVAGAWFFPDGSNEYSERVLAGLQATGARVPHIWSLEIANLLLTGERRGRLTAAQSTHILRFLETVPIDVEASGHIGRSGVILTVAREYHLSAYDGAYLELAMREGLPLATQDRRLREAAVTAGVPLFD